MSDAPLRFNPDPLVHVVTFTGGALCVVVDDAVLEPERWRDHVLARRDDFRAALFNAYPGMEMPASETVQSALADYFRLRMQRHFPMRRLERARARFAMVTLAPAQLQPRQWIPHRDSAWIDPTHAIAASVLYLFEEPRLGGTAFYAPRQDDLATRQLVHDSSVLEADAFAQRHGVARAYPSDGGAYFERIGAVDARWNRIVFYDGRLFHSGDIPDPALLADDPLRGRLTLNGFFSGRADARSSS